MMTIADERIDGEPHLQPREEVRRSWQPQVSREGIQPSTRRLRVPFFSPEAAGEGAKLTAAREHVTRVIYSEGR